MRANTDTSFRTVSWLMAAAVAFVPAVTSANESCSALEGERQIINREIASLLENYPGTHVVIGLCGAAAKSEYDRSQDGSAAAATFGACAVIGCALVGFDSCQRVALRWFNLSLRTDDIATRKRKLSCS
jgi:hypothetical protein